MVQQVTQGIKVSVETHFEGVFSRNNLRQYAFSYTVTIENQRRDPVQLISRYWKIKDALNNTEIVRGEGVIGLKPIIKPGHEHSYSSGCILLSPLGSMQGYYNMVNLSSATSFRAKIPVFKLHAPFAVN